ncbi:unnamed protein product [Symbiodinium pilosum]|uniref:Uncharacterized protein n=1 Tax=Symbiodinium pilosum TaxID=2952 RepID=A0A812QG56_SYMPI|nr:unnamed protein product [Symbiodinium pilosum]
MDGGKDGGALGGTIGSENPAMMGCGCGKGGMSPMGGMCGMGPGMCGGMGMPMGGGMMGKGGMPGAMPGSMPGSMPGAMGAGMGMGNMMPNMMGNMGGTMGNGMMGMGGMNPGMNPMMAMMGMMMGMQAAMGGGSEATADATPTIKSEDKHVDPRVKAICNDFGISGDTVMRLNDAMREREDYDEDLQALHKLMERATKDGKKPLEVMLAQIRAIRANRFPGKELLDPDVWEFICKYNLDDRVMNRLIDTLNNRKNKRKETLQALNDRLGNAQQPTGLGLLVRLLEGLDESRAQRADRLALSCTPNHRLALSLGGQRQVCPPGRRRCRHHRLKPAVWPKC